MFKVSIAMPAYNVQKYIAATIESILAQTYKNWELVICDDCSSDNTVNIIERYQSKHHNIVLIKRETNSGGCRLPRFDAILASKGEFVCPIDADDTIEETYLEKLVQEQRSKNCDIVLSKMVLCDENLKPRSITIPKESYIVRNNMSGRDATKETIGCWNISMNGLLAKNYLYKKYIAENYESNYNGAFSDEIDHRKLLMCATKVSTVDASYFYRQQSNSIVHSVSASSFKSLIANLNLLEFVVENFNDEKELLVNAYDEYLEKVYRAQQRLYFNYQSYNKEEKATIKQLIKDSFYTIQKYKPTYNKKRNKLFSISFLIFKFYTWTVYKIIKLKA